MISAKHTPFLPVIRVAFLTLICLSLHINSAWSWTPDPTVNTAISTDGGSAVDLVSDGFGGAFLTWEAGRVPGNDLDIYAQQINTAGAAQWTPGGVTVFEGIKYQYKPQVIPDGSGGVIITWQSAELPDGNIYAQRISANGAILWPAGGVAICTATDDQYYPKIVSDGSGGAIIVWDDRRGSSPDLYGQRINANGTPLWTANGIKISSANVEYSGLFQIISNGSGGAIVTWNFTPVNTNSYIYAQAVNASGAVPWGKNGVVVSSHTNFLINPAMITDGSGGAIITWEKFFFPTDRDVFAQWIDAAGAVKWTVNGVAVSAPLSNQEKPRITGDGFGGAIITWKDDRNGNYDIFAQRVDAAGTVKWISDVAVCTAANEQGQHQIVSDGAGGAIITWQDNRIGTDRDIYARRIKADGTPQGAADGVAICTATGMQDKPQIVTDQAGGAIIAWDNYQNNSPGIYAQRFYSNNSLLAFSIGGVVTGLKTGNSLVLKNNGGEELKVNEDGGFTFINALNDGDAYDVTVFKQPDSHRQTCKIFNNTGTVAGSNVTDIEARCAGLPWPMFLPAITGIK